ncbi:MAG: hypothetical protein ACE5GQ_02280, partial [Nitrospinales bacterium]
FVEMLRRGNMTLEEYKSRIRDQILISQVKNFNTRTRVRISKKKVKHYYKAHRKELRTVPKVHARHILFLLDEKMSEEQKQAKREKANEVFGGCFRFQWRRPGGFGKREDG